jgi:phage tail sheath protein FI
MPSYLTPGVYVEEVPSQSKPIEGVGTAVAAFVGVAPGGPANLAMRISNWSQFAKLYGDPAQPENGPFMEGSYLAHAVYGYFQNGGGVCWIVRVGVDEKGPSQRQAALPAASDKSLEAFRAVARDGVDGDVQVELVAEKPAAKADGEDGADDATFTLIVTSGNAREEHDGLTLKKGRTNIATKVNAASTLVRIEELAGTESPALGKYTLQAPSAPSRALTPRDFEGDVAKREGVGALAGVDEITMVCVPDLMALVDGDDSKLRDQQGKLIAHCEMAGDRMAILDAPADLIPQDVHEWRNKTAGYDSKYATLYWPWLEVMDPLTSRPLMVPPSGHVAGVWARTDNTRGVHKAPANEVVLGVNGLAFQITQEEQGALNQSGINCIRSFPGRGIRIWGARTLSSDPEWRYLNVRRLFNYLSESILEGTQWAVFEPNDERLWIRLRIAVGSFLTRTWREGALFGATPEEAFYVKCDSETNPTDVIDAGQVVVEVGIAPVKPAEFVIFRISQYSAGAAQVEG